MTEGIVNELSESKDSYKKTLAEVKVELKETFSIETILSNLEQEEKLIGAGKLNDLNKEGFNKLIIGPKEKIRKKVSVHQMRMVIKFPTVLQET